MQQLILLDYAVKFAMLVLAVLLVGIFIGYVMGRATTRVIRENPKEEKFDPGPAEIDEATFLDEALEEELPELEERIETIQT